MFKMRILRAVLTSQRYTGGTPLEERLWEGSTHVNTVLGMPQCARFRCVKGHFSVFMECRMVGCLVRWSWYKQEVHLIRTSEANTHQQTKHLMMWLSLSRTTLNHFQDTRATTLGMTILVGSIFHQNWHWQNCTHCTKNTVTKRVSQKLLVSGCIGRSLTNHTTFKINLPPPFPSISLFLSVSLSLSLCVSVSLSLSLSLCVSVSLSLSLSLCVCLSLSSSS